MKPMAYRLSMLALLFVPLADGQEIAPSSSPNDITSVGGKLFFSADDGVHGRELWMYDEADKVPSIVKDIWTGERGSNPSDFWAFGDRLLFAAETPDESKPGASLGTELWISDGTAAGTQLVLNIHPGATSGFRKWMASRDGIAYFEGDEDEHGRELWRTDGTEKGTRIISDLWLGTDGAQPTICDHGWLSDGRLVFMGFRDAKKLLFVFNPADESFHPLREVDVEANVLRDALGVVFFTTKDADHGWELWKTNGTEDSTVLVKDINPDAADGSPATVYPFGDKAYFQAKDKEHGAELWVTDGTDAGTHMVKDVNPGAANSNPSCLTPSGSYLYFTAIGLNIGMEIWRTDGTEAGTILLKDINSRQANSDPYHLTSVGDGIVFGATSSEYGVELWGSDGSVAGTRLVKDIVRGPSMEITGNPYFLVKHGSRVYFHATSLEEGVELWRTDGTTNGTTLVYDICTERRPNPDSSPHNLTVVGQTLFFVAQDSEHGNELWRTIDTPERVQIVKDIFPGSASSDPQHLTAVGNVLYFSADDGTNGDELWLSDGTEAGTRLLEDYAASTANSGPKELTIFNNTLYFVAWNEKYGEELLMVHDMAVLRVKDINPGSASSSPRELVVVGNVLYFRANDGQHGDELWSSCGAEYNTQMVQDISPLTTVSILPGCLTPIERKLFFVASDGIRGQELWWIDMDDGRPSLVADIARSVSSVYLDNVDINRSRSIAR